jgi:hypothetical protein
MAEQDPHCCCPKFDPEPFQEKEITWKDKHFVKDETFCFFYIPLNFGGMMKRVDAKLEAANAMPKDKEELTMIQLVDPCSPWLAEVYVASTTENVPNAEIAKLSGTFLTKVYEGLYYDMNKWVNDMKTYAKEKGKAVKCIYARYTECPKCAKKHGKNYVVLMAQIE